MKVPISSGVEAAAAVAEGGGRCRETVIPRHLIMVSRSLPSRPSVEHCSVSS